MIVSPQSAFRNPQLSECWLKQKRIEEQPRRAAKDGAEVRVFGEEDDVPAPRRLFDHVSCAAQQTLCVIGPDEAAQTQRPVVVREDDRVRALFRWAEEKG